MDKEIKRLDLELLSALLDICALGEFRMERLNVSGGVQYYTAVLNLYGETIATNVNKSLRLSIMNTRDEVVAYFEGRGPGG